jgi:[ribosomal protein S5]-alanine N-acetyltransferase
MMVIETKRLILREFNTDDAAFLLVLMNSPNWLRFIGDRGVRSSISARKYITNKLISSYQKFGFGLYLVMLKEGEVPIGMCGLVKREMLKDVDIGFALLPEYSGKGYAIESALSVLKYGQTELKLKRIVAITMKENAASIKLLEKLGLTFEKVIQYNGEALKLFAINNTE